MTKQEIALAQLRRAIDLYEAEDYVCAITLSGAAEELLGRMAQRDSGTNAIEDMVANVSEVAAFFGTEPAPRRHLIAKRNRVRNELKHQDGGQNAELVEDFRDAAEAMIGRALNNWSEAFGSDPDDEVVQAFLRAHC